MKKIVSCWKESSCLIIEISFDRCLLNKSSPDHQSQGIVLGYTSLYSSEKFFNCFFAKHKIYFERQHIICETDRYRTFGKYTLFMKVLTITVL